MVRAGTSLNTGFGRVKIVLRNPVLIWNVIKTEDEGGHMKRVLLLAMLGVLLVFVACTNVRSGKDVPRVLKDDLKAALGSPDLVLIDVRAQNDWEKSGEKITGAVRMDPKTVDTWAGTLPKDKEIVLYCA
jgi:hypothetical protein